MIEVVEIFFHARQEPIYSIYLITYSWSSSVAVNQGIGSRDIDSTWFWIWWSRASAAMVLIPLDSEFDDPGHQQPWYWFHLILNLMSQGIRSHGIDST